MFVKILSIVLIIFNPLFLAFFHRPSAENIAATENKNAAEIETAELPLSQSLKDAANPSLASLISGLMVSANGQANPDFLPIRDWSVEEPDIEAKAALVFGSQNDKILYQKNIEEALPIASLTKLMTALIILENADPEQIAAISKKDIEAYGDIGNLVVDEKISVKNLLYIALLESSNDAAAALASSINLGASLPFGSEAPKFESFVFLMNQKAEELGLKNTHFIDPTGYTPQNVSTALDLVKLVKYTFIQPLLWEILKTQSIDLQSADGKINHHLVNNNQLLRLSKAIGGKTGYTEEAGGCIILVTQTPKGDYLISVILGSEERFSEMEKLVNWVEKAYLW